MPWQVPVPTIAAQRHRRVAGAGEAVDDGVAVVVAAVADLGAAARCSRRRPAPRRAAAGARPALAHAGAAGRAADAARRRRGRGTGPPPRRPRRRSRRRRPLHTSGVHIGQPPGHVVDQAVAVVVGAVGRAALLAGARRRRRRSGCRGRRRCRPARPRCAQMPSWPLLQAGALVGEVLVDQAVAVVVGAVAGLDQDRVGDDRRHRRATARPRPRPPPPWSVPPAAAIASRLALMAASVVAKPMTWTGMPAARSAAAAAAGSPPQVSAPSVTSTTRYGRQAGAGRWPRAAVSWSRADCRMPASGVVPEPRSSWSSPAAGCRRSWTRRPSRSAAPRGCPALKETSRSPAEKPPAQGAAPPPCQPPELSEALMVGQPNGLGRAGGSASGRSPPRRTRAARRRCRLLTLARRLSLAWLSPQPAGCALQAGEVAARALERAVAAGEGGAAGVEFIEPGGVEGDQEAAAGVVAGRPASGSRRRRRREWQPGSAGKSRLPSLSLSTPSEQSAITSSVGSLAPLQPSRRGSRSARRRRCRGRREQAGGAALGRSSAVGAAGSAG